MVLAGGSVQNNIAPLQPEWAGTIAVSQMFSPAVHGFLRQQGGSKAFQFKGLAGIYRARSVAKPCRSRSKGCQPAVARPFANTPKGGVDVARPGVHGHKRVCHSHAKVVVRVDFHIHARFAQHAHGPPHLSGV